MKSSKIKIVFYIVIIFLLFIQIVIAQKNNKLDSLKLILKTAKHDTTKIKTRYEIGEITNIYRVGYFDSIINDCEKILKLSPNEEVTKSIKLYLANSLSDNGYNYKNQGNISKALEYNNRCLKISEEIGFKEGITSSLNNIGSIYNNLGNISKALEYFQRSIKVREEIGGDKQGIAISYNNIGYIYNKQGDIAKALEYYHKCLKICEQIGRKKGIITSMGNIGSIYLKQGDIAKALEYYQRSLKISQEIGDKESTADIYNYLGFIYNEQGNTIKAFEYYNKCLKVYEDIKDKDGIASYYYNIGSIYFKQSKNAKKLNDDIKSELLINEALEHFNKSLKIYEEIEKKENIVINLVDIGEVYFFKNELNKALDYATKAHNLAIDLGFPNNIERSARMLKKINEKNGNVQKAYEYYKLEIKMHDSIANNENIINTQKQQAKYEYGKKSAVDSIANSKAMEIKNLAIGKQKVVIYFFVGGFIIVFIFLFIIFRLFIQKGKANVKLAHQNEEIIQQKEEILSQRNEIERQRDTVRKQNQILAKQKEELNDKKIITDQENAILKIKNIEAEVQHLKQQIHPHFLFNSLYTLKTLLLDNDDAEDYLVKLCNLLRTSLSSDDINMVKIKDEVSFCTDYLEMQKIRFGDAIKYSINIPEEIQNTGNILIFALQQLIENAIKHNALTEELPLHIRIFNENNRIIVSNNIQIKSTIESSTGVGLANITDRYKILTGDNVIINSDNNVFSVSIKIING